MGRCCPGLVGKNFHAHNNVLVIQESDKPVVDNASCNGILTFDFKTPVILRDFGLLDTDDGNVSQILVCTLDGGQHIVSASSLGDNLYQTIDFCLKNTIQCCRSASLDWELSPILTFVMNGPLAPVSIPSILPCQAISSSPLQLVSLSIAPSATPPVCAVRI